MSNVLTPSRLYQGTLGTSTVTLYTVPVSTVTMVRNLWLANSNGSSRTYTVYIVKSGQSPATGNKIFAESALAGNDRVGWPMYHPLEAGDTIRAKASSASSIGITVSGIAITGDFGDIRPMRLVQGTCTTSPITQYTVPTGKRAIIKNVYFCNTDSSDRTVRFDTVKAGQSNSSSSQLYNALSIAANTSVYKRLAIVMAAGDTIRISASVKNVLNVYVSGIEQTL